MGRPKIGEPVLVRIPDDLRARIVLRAAQEGITISELIRRVLLADDEQHRRA